MDDGFEKRKKSHEEKWAHDEALRFRVVARRNKLAGRWAAAELGYAGEAAEDYAKAVVAAEFEATGTDSVFRKLRADFDAAKLAHSDHVIRRKLDELLVEAADQIMREK